MLLNLATQGHTVKLRAYLQVLPLEVRDQETSLGAELCQFGEKTDKA